jgi:superfamily II DNA/RNA helicase
MTFTELGILPELAETLSARNIREPSEIQRLVIPALLAGNSSAPRAGNSPALPAGNPSDLSALPDLSASEAGRHLLFSSPTGTGKTLAYALPLLQQTIRPAENRRVSGPEILILAPTYELCAQIKKELDAPFSQGPVSGEARDFRSALLIGSAPLGRQIDTLKKQRPTALVGNPARVLQLVRMKKLSLKALRFLVLDEGDRLMADELFPETAELFRPPPECRIIACSATFSGKNRERLFSLTPDTRWKIIVQKENDILRKNIEHWAFFAEERKKTDMLRSFMAAVKPAKALVFTSRAAQVGRIVSRLQTHHLAAAGLWGDMDKKARKAAIDGFRKGGVTILVSSDLAARGLDIDGISHIIALDIPEGGEIYIHRAGRTARAGKRGIMASFGGEEELRRLAGIEKKLGIVVYPKELYGGRVCAPIPDEDE